MKEISLLLLIRQKLTNFIISLKNDIYYKKTVKNGFIDFSFKAINNLSCWSI